MTTHAHEACLYGVDSTALSCLANLLSSNMKAEDDEFPEPVAEDAVGHVDETAKNTWEMSLWLRFRLGVGRNAGGATRKTIPA